MNNKLKSILKDFYDCLCIPVQFVDNKFNPMYKVGFCNDSDLVLERTDI